MFELSIFVLFPLIIAPIIYFIKSIKLQYTFSLVVAALHLIISVLVFINFTNPKLPWFFGIDSISRFFITVLSNVYFWVVLTSYSFLKRPASRKAEEAKKYYFSLLNLYIAFNSAAMLSNHFGLYWVTVEATTLSVAPLIYFYRNEESLEAMWKYVFIVSIGIAFAFVGILFLTLSAKGTSIEGQQLFFSEYIKSAKELNTTWLKVSFIFIFVGLSTKIGIAPMHSADVDATSNAPSPIAALMSGSLRLTALIGVMRILQITAQTSVYEFAKLLLIIGGMLSVFVTFISMFKVNNYKRMLSYSSVEHLGIIAIGLGIGGIAFIGALYHAIYNSVVKIVLFLSAGIIHHKYDTREVSRVRAVLNKLPKSGWIYLFALLAISGIPPFGIFFSEITIFEGMLFSNQSILLVLFMFMLLFIFINMSKISFTMLYQNDDTSKNIENENVDIIHFASVILLLGISLLAIFNPDVLYQNILNIAKEFNISL